MMSGGTMMSRTQSMSDVGTAHKRVESAAISVASDDLGTDYWIKQYNKENRSKQKKKKKKNKKRKLNKTKSARHKLKSKRLSKRLRSHAQAQSTHDPSTSMALLDSNSGDSNKLFRDD